MNMRHALCEIFVKYEENASYTAIINIMGIYNKRMQGNHMT